MSWDCLGLFGTEEISSSGCSWIRRRTRTKVIHTLDCRDELNKFIRGHLSDQLLEEWDRCFFSHMRRSKYNIIEQFMKHSFGGGSPPKALDSINLL